MLTPVPVDRLDVLLDAFESGLSPWPSARKVFTRVAATRALALDLTADLYAGHTTAVALAQGLGMETCDEAPGDAFSWDGRVVRTRSETAVLLHEIAHWQVAPPKRRPVPDFGLGAGPETGRVEEADAARCVDDAIKEREEDLASLLGILWEAYLGGPAIIAFCEQNWLELHDRPGTAQHFSSCVEDLVSRGLIDSRGIPQITN